MTNGTGRYTEEDWTCKNQQATGMLMIAVQQHPTLQNAVLTADDVYGQAVDNVEKEVRGGVETYVDNLQTPVYDKIRDSSTMGELSDAQL